MTLLSQTLTNSYPRKLIWWIDCDGCHTVGSDPKWSDRDLPLEDFRAKGWECGHFDLCPTCVVAGSKEIPRADRPELHTIFRPTPAGVTP